MRWLPISLLLLCSLSSVARADEEEEPKTTTVWYGWQTLTSDGVAAGLAVGGLAGPKSLSPAMLVTSALTYGVGAPLVHVAHDRPLAGLASLGLRAGMPIAGGLAGFALDLATQKDCHEFCIPIFGIIGFALGVPAAMATDAFVLGHEKKVVDTSSIRIFPTANARGNGGDVGIAGTF